MRTQFQKLNTTISFFKNVEGRTLYSFMYANQEKEKCFVLNFTIKEYFYFNTSANKYLV